jgi:hypothetical protein
MWVVPAVLGPRVDLAMTAAWLLGSTCLVRCALLRVADQVMICGSNAVSGH